MTRLNRQGFISLETFLIILVLAIIGGAGYFVYQAQNNTNATLDQAIKTTEELSNSKKAKAAKSTIPSGWVKYDGGSLSFYYPSTWLKNVCDQNNVLLGPDKDAAGKCNSDAYPEVSVNWAIGDNGSDYHFNQDNYKGFQKADVKIDAASGYKESGTLNLSDEFGIGPPNGTKQVQYVLYGKGITIQFSYIQDPRFKDVSADFETMVNKTLKFN